MSNSKKMKLNSLKCATVWFEKDFNKARRMHNSRTSPAGLPLHSII
uniref:Uncharacterized protein n=1 Tax=Arundo donax TaxID=35708 RepID=A0A0A9UWA8_ARUDO